jgi:hypothetical protein
MLLGVSKGEKRVQQSVERSGLVLVRVVLLVRGWSCCIVLVGRR